MRVLVILPLYGGSLPVGRYCVSALRELGHLVEVFEAPEFYASFQAFKGLKVTSDRLQYLENSYLQVLSQAILAKTETFEPDLVLAMAQAPLSIQALKRLKRDGVATAMWFVEDYRLFTYWQAFAPHYDFFAVIQKDDFLSQLQHVGMENALYLPLAAQPDVHKRLELSSVERRKFGSAVSFMGAGYPNRRMAFRELVRFDFKLWGTEWDGDVILAPYVQMAGARVSSEDCVRIFNATTININLHSSMQAKELVSGGDFVNPRTFEVAACGAFQLVDRRGLMAELFEEGELAIFDSMEELAPRIEHYLANPEERIAIAKRGQARVLADHTYAARMRTLLDFVASRRPGWPKPRTTGSALEGLPPELAQEITALLERLGLPSDTGFDDLVWAVRQQQGALGGLDAAVLFLDEWRKLYARKG
ncbi:MAG TPA: glycosyltransferase [Humidesulfovibrio sp.]|uniref:CgeB family protein n=1 Tax=Humidesulfovibrio sp. TaxID=2910988 RepID=UPI002C2C1742|nr:glycosyltransferase [Humidesulfovibrio sp.]HWR05172.1 glycosyltransferase [Humidesulfovibrio sp.]